MGRREVAGLVASLAGVVLIARPTFLFGLSGASLDPSAVAAALAGAVLSSVAYVTVRKLRESDHHLVVIFYFTLISSPASIPPMWGRAVWPSPFQWVLLAAVGVITLTAQVFLTKGLHRERAGRAMSISYVQVVFAALWGLVIFGEVPDLAGVAGAALVFTGTMIVASKDRYPVAPPAGGSDPGR
jgi:drug/metabolite transporter (DMT)-like permease